MAVPFDFLCAGSCFSSCFMSLVWEDPLLYHTYSSSSLRSLLFSRTLALFRKECTPSYFFLLQPSYTLFRGQVGFKKRNVKVLVMAKSQAFCASQILTRTFLLIRIMPAGVHALQTWFLRKTLQHHWVLFIISTMKSIPGLSQPFPQSLFHVAFNSLVTQNYIFTTYAETTCTKSSFSHYSSFS